MKLDDFLTYAAAHLLEEREQAMSLGLDAPLNIPFASHLRTVGTLHLYQCPAPQDRPILPDVPMTLLPGNDLEPTEGYILGTQDGLLIIQTFDHVGETLSHCTIIPDTSGLLETGEQRLSDMANKPDSFTLGPAERLVPWLTSDQNSNQASAREGIPSAILATFWGEDRQTRWTKLATFIVEQIKKNKRILLLAPDHPTVDALTGTVARALKMAALPYKSLLCRYETPMCQEAAGISLQELGFEAQMYQFFAKANSNKVALRKKYDRFRELTPILAYKREKQKDLNEVKLLEWRLLTQLSEWQGKVKQIDKIVTDYEAIPIWKRIGLQVTGKNIETLAEYRIIYQTKIQGLMTEVEVAQTRIKELIPEATIPKDLRPEYDDLKDEIKRLGGTKKIREMLAAGEGTNRQAFAQNKRIMATTPGKVLADPLFRKVPYDILIIEEAPRIPAPLILAAAGLIRERIVLSGNTTDLQTMAAENTANSHAMWPQRYLDMASIPATSVG
ncbi:MAG: hypothetical protein KC590_10040 [Nitrospira sp.]|nr:hypothetical protein [Nitrospira sp.]MCB9709655.1 hypothetical protein [Nitrospiraceae bacterium]